MNDLHLVELHANLAFKQQQQLRKNLLIILYWSTIQITIQQFRLKFAIRMNRALFANRLPHQTAALKKRYVAIKLLVISLVFIPTE